MPIHTHHHQGHLYRQPQIRPAKRPESRWAMPGRTLPSRCPWNASDSGMLRRVHSTSKAGKMPSANRARHAIASGRRAKAGVDERRQARADGCAGLHEADPAATIFVADHLTSLGRCDRPIRIPIF